MKQYNRFKLLTVFGLCLLLSGCGYPLVVIPVTVLFGLLLLLLLLTLLPDLPSATIAEMALRNTLKAVGHYLLLTLGVSAILAVDALVARFGGTVAKRQAQTNVYQDALQRAIACAAVTGVVLVYLYGLQGNVTSFLLTLFLVFSYILLLSLGANHVRESIAALSFRIDNALEGFPQQRAQIVPVADYDEKLSRLNRVQGYGYFAFLLAPVLLLLSQHVFLPTQTYSLIDCVGLGLLLFGIFALIYVAYRAPSLSEALPYNFSEGVDFEHFKQLFRTLYDIRMVLLEDRVHSIVIGVLSISLAVNLLALNEAGWSEVLAAAGLAMGLLALVTCWLPFYYYQRHAVEHAVTEIAKTVSDEPAILEAKETLIELCPLFPAMSVTKNIATIVGMSGMASLMATLGKLAGTQ